MATWLTSEDVITRWIGPSAPLADSPTLLTMIEDAEDAVLEVYPRIQERIDANTLPLNRVKRVVAGVVIRAYKIAQEYRTSYSEATGPFSHSVSMGTDFSRNISLTDEEIRTLAPERGKRAISVSMAPHMHSNNDGLWLNTWVGYSD